MDLILPGLLLVLLANQIVVRLEIFRRSDAVFWAIQVLDVAVGIALMVFGLPGLEHVPAVAWVVGLLFILRAAQNWRLRSLMRAAALADERDRLRERRPPRHDYPPDEEPPG